MNQDFERLTMLAGLTEREAARVVLERAMREKTFSDVREYLNRTRGTCEDVREAVAAAQKALLDARHAAEAVQKALLPEDGD